MISDILILYEYMFLPNPSTGARYDTSFQQSLTSFELRLFFLLGQLP